MVDYKKLGKRIKERRGQCRLTQEKLAELVNLSVPHISHIENGQTKVSLEKLVLIANTLHTTVDSLLSDSIEESEGITSQEMIEVIHDCTGREMRDLLRILKYFKEFLRTRD